MKIIQQLSFKTEIFEGPLDLLLHLISKHKVDIIDVKISLLVNQYIEYMDKLSETQLTIASEFLEMAARLVHMKSQSLLPRQDEYLELADELIGELCEYSLCKQVAAQLQDMYKGNIYFVREPVELDIDNTYTRSEDVRDLLSSYYSAAIKAKRKLPPPKDNFEPIVERKIVSVNGKIINILRKLRGKSSMAFKNFFSGDRASIVATFLALLELVRSGRIELDEEQTVKLKGRAK